MDIRITAKELLEKGVWDEACDLLGCSIWAMNERFILGDHEFTLTEEQAKTLGLLGG